MRELKNRAKNFLWIFMSLVMVLSMTACDDTVENMPANGKVFIGEDDYTNITDDEETTEEDTEPESETEYTAPEISIVMVGDVLLHDRVEKSALQEDGTYNYEPIFTYLKDDIQAAGLLDYYRGNKLILINKTPTPKDNIADLIVTGSIGEIFSQI